MQTMHSIDIANPADCIDVSSLIPTWQPHVVEASADVDHGERLQAGVMTPAEALLALYGVQEQAKAITQCYTQLRDETLAVTTNGTDVRSKYDGRVLVDYRKLAAFGHDLIVRSIDNAGFHEIAYLFAVALHPNRTMPVHLHNSYTSFRNGCASYWSQGEPLLRFVNPEGLGADLAINYRAFGRRATEAFDILTPPVGVDQLTAPSHRDGLAA